MAVYKEGQEKGALLETAPDSVAAALKKLKDSEHGKPADIASNRLALAHIAREKGTPDQQDAAKKLMDAAYTGMPVGFHEKLHSLLSAIDKNQKTKSEFLS